MPTREDRALPPWVTVVDLLSIALLAFGTYIFFFGGFRTSVVGVRLSITSSLRLLAQGALLIAVRHWIHRRPTLWQRAAGLVQPLAGVPRSLRVTAATFAATRLSVLLVGYCAIVTIGYPPGAPPWRASIDELGNLPARWDSGWYIGIATQGYRWNKEYVGPQNIAFFPVLPILMRAGARLVSSNPTDPATAAWAGTIVSLIAFFGALLYLFYLAREDIGEERAVVAMALLGSYPFAVFFGAAYTESLFLLSAVGAFFHVRRRQPGRVAVWGLLAGLVRPNGFLLTVPLALHAFSGLAEKPSKGFTRTALPLLCATAPVVGMLAYSAYIFRLTGDPFMWADIQKYWNRDFQGLRLLDQTYSVVSQFGAIAFMGGHTIDALDGLGMLFAAATIWPVARRLGWSQGAFVLLNFLLPLMTGGVTSMGRYSSVLFPCFIWLAAAVPPSLRMVLLVLFAIGQGFIAVLFFTWRPLI